MKPNTFSTRRREKTLDEQLAELFEIEESYFAPAVYSAPPAEPAKTVIESAQPVRRSYFCERFIFILLATWILCCLGGFFLFVPLLPAFTVGVLLSGVLAMFWIGIQLGSTRWYDQRQTR
ncbi:MAG: hypothetical protein ABSB35_01405 [Bryobacteraceae bacterium]